jgi:hypothetical protein
MLRFGLMRRRTIIDGSLVCRPQASLESHSVLSAGDLRKADLHADLGLLWVDPIYVFARPVLGGQASVGLGAWAGQNSARLNGTLTASVPPFSLVRADSISDTTHGFGDLFPQAYLKWNRGVDNFMVYGTGDIPVGTYSSTDLGNLGIGHGALDGGAGHT